MIHFHSEEKEVLQALVAQEFRKYRETHGLSSAICSKS